MDNKILNSLGQHNPQIFDDIKGLLASAGWDTRAVDEAIEILDSLLSEDIYNTKSKIVQSRTEILKNWRYLEYWYFEGAPLSVQVALYIGLKTEILTPPPSQSDRITEFNTHFTKQLAFKTALNTSETVGGWLFPGEPELLWEGVHQTRNIPGNLCEIGSWTGRSSIMLASACQHVSPNKTLHIIDDWRFGGQPDLYPYLTDNRQLKDEFEHNLAPWGDRLHIHEGVFQKVHLDLLKASPSGLSMIFHDAGHTPEDFERDLPIIAALLNRGGLLFVHDYISKNFKPGHEVIDRWVANNPEFTIEKVVGSCAQIKKS